MAVRTEVNSLPALPSSDLLSWVQGPFSRHKSLKCDPKGLYPDFFVDFPLCIWYDEGVIGAVVESPQDADSRFPLT